jgi:hypothetical protein
MSNLWVALPTIGGIVAVTVVAVVVTVAYVIVGIERAVTGRRNR